MTDHPVPPVDTVPAYGQPEIDPTTSEVRYRYFNKDGSYIRTEAIPVPTPSPVDPAERGAAWAFEQLVREVDRLQDTLAALDGKEIPDA